jgi:hypothetical protein
MPFFTPRRYDFSSSDRWENVQGNMQFGMHVSSGNGVEVKLQTFKNL